MANSAATVTPLEGKTSIDDKMTFGPERLSYDSADIIAGRIASNISRAVKGRLIVIAGTSLLADFANLQAVYVMLRGLERDYEALAAYVKKTSKRREPQVLEGESFDTMASVVTGAAALAIAPASPFLSAALGLVSLFREDVEYHGAQTSVDRLAFELALAAKLTNGDGDAAGVFVPDLMVVQPSGAHPDSLQNRLEAVQNAKLKAWISIGPSISELVSREGELDQAAKSKDQAAVDRLSAQVSNLRKELDPVVSPLGRIDQRFESLQTQWNQIDKTTGLSVLARLLRAEAIRGLENPLYLHAAIVATGGHHRISRNLFRMMFLGDGLSFTGGAIARWALLEENGAVAHGGILTAQRTSGTHWGFGDSTIVSPPAKNREANPPDNGIET